MLLLYAPNRAHHLYLASGWSRKQPTWAASNSSNSMASRPCTQRSSLYLYFIFIKSGYCPTVEQAKAGSTSWLREMTRFVSPIVPILPFLFMAVHAILFWGKYNSPRFFQFLCTAVHVMLFFFSLFSLLSFSRLFLGIPACLTNEIKKKYKKSGRKREDD